jgi:CheY-like chemotaxis protein
LLRSEGNEVRTALDGPTALSLCETFRPEIMLLDIGLPHMNGFEVARRIRNEPSLEGVHLIALSGYGQQEDRQRGAEAGFDHYLVKPARTEALLDLISSFHKSEHAAMHGSAAPK